MGGKEGTWGPLTRISEERNMKSQILLSHRWRWEEPPLTAETRPREAGLCPYYAMKVEA